MLSAGADGRGQMSKELEAWLSKLSLEQYAPAFRANAIDMAVLADLTDIDLIELGVAPLGHRKRLLSAIANLRQSGSEATPSIRAQAERRQMSVLFCDVVGSTGFPTGWIPKSWRRSWMTIQDASEKIRQKGGYVAQFQGDGVMAYFGWPTVHEDDASRAVAVGLELAEALPRLSTPGGLPIEVRVGVATGLVVVGGESAADGRAVGETPNIAARLQAEAEPNTVVVSPLTARLAGRSFHYKSLGKRAMRGVPEPLEVLQVMVRVHRSIASKHCAHDRLRPWSGAVANLSCCSRAGSEPLKGKGRSCCCPAMLGLASHGWSRRLGSILDGVPRS